MLNVTSDLGIPSFVTIAHWMESSQEFIEFGSGAHFDARIAALRAMTELSQFLSIGLMGARNQNPSSQGSNSGSPAPFRLQDYPYLTPNGAALVRPDPARSSFTRAGARLRRGRQARGARFPRARSDAARYRGALDFPEPCLQLPTHGGRRNGSCVGNSRVHVRPRILNALLDLVVHG